jgi:hypothetical protein
VAVASLGAPALVQGLAVLVVVSAIYAGVYRRIRSRGEAR